MSQGSSKSPKGFFRLEPIIQSGEAHLGLNHVEDDEPFVTKSKRPWVSRRKSRRPEPPWKQFVTVFRVAPVPGSLESASSGIDIRSESPASYGSLEMDKHPTTSSILSTTLSLSREYSLEPSEHEVTLQCMKHETGLQDLFDDLERF